MKPISQIPPQSVVKQSAAVPSSGERSLDFMYLNPTAREWRTHHVINPDILSFHQILPSYNQTPLTPLPSDLGASLGIKHIFLKDESNRFGLPAFKILGASWASYRAVTQVLALLPTTSLHDVKIAATSSKIQLHAATDGNFGRAVARMAALMGVEALIYVPKIMYEDTKALIREEGAKVVVVQGDYNAAVHAAASDAETREGGLLVQDDAWQGYEEIPAWVVEGYSTMMVEIDAQMHNAVGKPPDLIIVPVGVGSLAQAVVAHFKSSTRDNKVPMVMAVEPDTAACLKASLEASKSTTIETGETRMCGMNCGTVSSLAWPLLKDGVDASIDVTDYEAENALDMLSQMQIRTGPCSAGTLAALLKTSRSGEGILDLSGESSVVLLGTEGPR